ncbi:S-formylglutathione hydrolase [Rubrobacter marinus]|uniref:S-formylglutathione hydrolase n=1 Tax=Rubrobacter marinus TaxID=2653852 RepID=A0A6G8PVD1_9ACTN|nr:S-formylglutathione hydrolase [Rubrobacter marinus]QIN78133.1 S-formylglutathione hydrolase [Rubrobacter marinus]
MSNLETLSEHRSFGGAVTFHEHRSEACDATMRFSVYAPPQAAEGPVPVLYYLAGLTSTEANFMEKAGAQRLASELGLMLVAPDTSPRGLDLPGEHDDYDLGSGAGFYIDATVEPWSRHYKTYSYVTGELPGIVESSFPARADARGIFGHSMGGHGALTIALKNPERYRSVSAFAPISAPTRAPWGKKIFSNYLGPDEESWREHDASELIKSRGAFPDGRTILVDQGTGDQFLEEQLYPGVLEEACAESGQPLEIRRHEGYDHGYYFISTFVDDHLRHHAAALNA